MSRVDTRAPRAGSTMTAMRRALPVPITAPCSTTHIPDRERTRAVASSEALESPSTEASTGAVSAVSAGGKMRRSQAPPGRSASQRSTPGVVDSTDSRSSSTTRPGLTAGDLVRKPRGEWHTFWNAGDGPLRILEIITPGGLEELFRLMGSPDAAPDLLDDADHSYGCTVDEDQTAALIERHELRPWL
jgi:hypothetical protein